MRHLETAHVELYYPAEFADAAHHIAARLERCATVLRGKPQSDRNSDRMLVYLTLANFNNAFVQAEAAGAPLQMVLPIHSTLEEDNFLLLGTVNQGNTGCHEATHYVQDQQTHGFWWYANIIGGPLVEPSQGLERWFTEGLAVWNEGHIDLKTGRPNSPFWHGMFEAAMTTRGNRPRSGDLALTTRDLYMTGAYLTSSHFIDYLVRRFGEGKLWQLIDREAGTVVPDVGISLIFRAVYGETLDKLLKDYGDEMASQPIRQRPTSQRMLVAEAGGFARIAVSPADGAIAEISEGYDYPLRLAIRDASGRMRLNLPLTQFLPGRQWVGLDAEGISGMRFSNDGKFLMFVGSSTTMDGDDASNLYALDTKNGRVIQSWELPGYGGDLTPDGAYVYVEVKGDTENLVRLDLSNSHRDRLTNFEAARAVGSPAVSPDGKRIAFALWNGASFDLALREEDGRIGMLTQDDRVNYGPRWIDDQHLLFLREWQGHWQAHVYDLNARTITPVTDAPYVVLDAIPGGRDNVVFLNRDGVQFTIDAAPLSLAATPATMAGAPEAVPPAMPEAVVPPVTFTSDRPAYGGEQLLIPLLHVPYVVLDPGSFPQGPVNASVVAMLAGSDRLGIHNYQLTVLYDTATRQPSFNASYLLNAWSPNLFTVNVARTVAVGSENRTASLSYDRTFWDIPVHVGFAGQEEIIQVEPHRTVQTNLVGPNASVSYDAIETTPYAGVRRSLRFGVSGGFYPQAFDSTQNVGDLRPTFGFTLPLPISRRHTLSVDITGHVMFGSSSILGVGGLSPGTTLLSCPTGSGPTCVRNPVNDAPSSVYGLSEYLQGYEDYASYTTHAIIGTAVYQYPIIIDRGWTSFLWVLPTAWVSELDVQVFGTDAILTSGTMRAVGGSLTLQTTWGQQENISLTYQFAYRFDDRLKPLNLIWLGF
jgi:hypothetical protein